MDNSWVQTDAYDFAAICKERNMSIIGWFPLGENSREVCEDYLVLDIGIIGKDNDQDDHNIYWCHAAKKWIDELIEDWDKLHKSGLK